MPTLTPSLDPPSWFCLEGSSNPYDNGPIKLSCAWIHMSSSHHIVQKRPNIRFIVIVYFRIKPWNWNLSARFPFLFYLLNNQCENTQCLPFLPSFPTNWNKNKIRCVCMCVMWKCKDWIALWLDHKLAARLPPSPSFLSLFDGWDNFLLQEKGIQRWPSYPDTQPDKKYHLTSIPVVIRV